VARHHVLTITLVSEAVWTPMYTHRATRSGCQWQHASNRKGGHWLSLTNSTGGQSYQLVHSTGSTHLHTPRAFSGPTRLTRCGIQGCQGPELQRLHTAWPRPLSSMMSDTPIFVWHAYASWLASIAIIEGQTRLLTS